jgi:hypothetical protein
MNKYLASAALLVLWLSPLIGLGNIIARNREIENSGRMHQGRLNEASDSWHSIQRQLSGANQILAVSYMNEATAIGEASKAMAAQDIENKKAEMERLEQIAKQKELKIAAVVANYNPPPVNGRPVILATLAVMIAAGTVWQLAKKKGNHGMKSLSAAIIVTAGVALVCSSQWSAASIMALTQHHSIDIAHTGVTTGIFLIIAGMLGWGYTLLTRADSSRSSDQRTI